LFSYHTVRFEWKLSRIKQGKIIVNQSNDNK
jgi:hypothetical protein